MKKIIYSKISTIALLLFTTYLVAQVGINNTSPAATLDITGNPTTTGAIDGVIPPRITGDQLKAKDAIYGTSQIGSIVYVTAAANPTTTKTANITSAGYYYFDGTLWRSINGDVLIFAGTGAAITIPASTVSTVNGNHTTSLLQSKTFTITQKALVFITTSVTVRDLTNMQIGVGSSLLFTTVPAGSTIPANALLVRDIKNAVGTTGTGNSISLSNLSAQVVLQPGTYTLALNAYMYATGTTGTLSATFAGSADRFDITAIPMQ